ncbi:MAG: copper resistance CopC/CopD family protein [Acidimicrobiia bacterium]
MRTVGEAPRHPPHRPAGVGRRRWATRLAATLAVAAAGLLVTATPAGAHATLETTDPPLGATLTEPPTSVEVTFSEPVRAPTGSVRLHDAGGKVVRAEEIEREDGGRTLRLDVGDLPDGGYVLSWRVVSVDGHPVSGGVTWRVGTASQEVDRGVLREVLAGEDGDPAVGTAAAVARAGLFAGLVLLVGGWAFAATAGRPRDGEPLVAGRPRRRLLAGGWAAAVVATVAGLGLQGADVQGLGLGDAVRPSVAGEVLGTDYGRAALARLVLLGLALVVLVVRRPWRLERLGRAALAVGLLVTVAYAGHARTGRWTALAQPLDVAHLLAGAVWLGGLAALLVSLRPDQGDDLDDGEVADVEGPVVSVARRFSTVALVAVGVVLVTGVVQGIRQTGGLDGLRETTYGQLLTAKAIAVVALLVLGYLSRTALRARDDGTLPRLRQSVAGEAAMAAVVLAVTSFLVAANPSEAGPVAGFSDDRVVDGTVFQVIVAPDRAGPVDIHLYVQDPAAGLTGAQDATAVLSLPEKDVEGIGVPLAPAGRNHFSANDVDVPIKGDWRLTIEVRIGELTQRTATFTVPIR